jgi:hypothetical protein
VTWEGKEERVELTHDTINKRDQYERRDFTWRTVFFGFVRSRRHVHRREVDDNVVFLDWHHPWLFFLAIGTMLLSTADAFLTLQLTDRGMIELNPIMNAAMEKSTLLFTATKLLATAFGILVLVYLAKAQFFNRFRTGLFLTMFFSFYSCLVCYELVNLFNLS